MFLGVSLLSNAQTIDTLHAEIDTQVWKPFKQAFESLDAEALNATYAKEVLRVTPDGIDTENAFRTKNVERFATNKADGITIALDFWFDSRKTNTTTSYEVGFYRLRFTSKNDDASVVYGQFHIVLKKMGGVWKIIQDWDTTSIGDVTIDEAQFGAREPQKF